MKNNRTMTLGEWSPKRAVGDHWAWRWFGCPRNMGDGERIREMMPVFIVNVQRGDVINKTIKERLRMRGDDEKCEIDHSNQ